MISKKELKKLPEYSLPKDKVFKKNGKLKNKFYKKELLKLQIELVKLQTWLKKTIKECLQYLRVLILLAKMEQ